MKGRYAKHAPFKSPDDQYPVSLTGRFPSAVQELRKDIDRLTTSDPSAHFLDPYIFRATQRQERQNSPYDLYTISWSTADNSLVDADLPDAVKTWNEKYAYPRLIIAGAHDILVAYEKKFGGIIPEVRGDYTEYWTDGIGTDALRTGFNRLAKERIVQAQTLWTMLHGAQPTSMPGVNDSWRFVMLGSEHTWGYYDPYAPFAKGVEATKAGYFESANKTSQNLLAAALQPITRSGDSFAVINTLSFPRTGVVTLHAAGNSVMDDTGNLVPSQRLTTGELAFIATNIPALGSRTYRATPVDYTAVGCTAVGDTLDNGIVKLTLNPQTGDIANLVFNNHDFVDANSKYALNSYRYLHGGDAPDKATAPSDVTITVKEKGPLIASLLVTSQAEGCKKLTREIRITAGSPAIECIDTLDKIPTRQKEGVHFAFAFNVPGATTRMDIPWGIMRPELDQLPGGNRNWLAFQRWVDISNDHDGVTWTCIEAPLIEFGDITANVMGMAQHPHAWLSHLPQTQTLLSWALNNHWFTNFPLEQGGIIPFHYIILPHGPYDPAVANRFGLDQNRPLIAVPTAKNPIAQPLVVVDNPRVFISTLEPSQDGAAVMLRLRSLSDQPETVTLTWPDRTPKSISNCQADEQPADPCGSKFDMLPYGAKTIRLEF